MLLAATGVVSIREFTVNVKDCHFIKQITGNIPVYTTLQFIKAALASKEANLLPQLCISATVDPSFIFA